MAERVVLELMGPSTGGIRQHVGALARNLPSSGWHARVAAPPTATVGLGLEAAVAVDVPSAPNPLRVARAASRVRSLASGADLVHAHGLKAGWVAVLARPAVPVVVTVHNLVLDEASGRASGILRRLEGWLPGRVDAVIAVSDAIAGRFGGPDERLRVIPPAGPTPEPVRTRSEARAALGIPDHAPLVVSVARLHPQKDLLTLLDATEHLRLLVPEARVVIIGEGPLEAVLRERIEERRLEATVVLAGPSANPADAMAAADVVVVTSLWESGPLVAAEAMFLGRPLVSTPVGFVPKLVDDRTSGRLITIGDAHGLADALAEILRDPSGARKMAEEGRRRALDLLGPGRLVAEVAQVYDHVLATHAAGSR